MSESSAKYTGNVDELSSAAIYIAELVDEFPRHIQRALKSMLGVLNEELRRHVRLLEGNDLDGAERIWAVYDSELWYHDVLRRTLASGPFRSALVADPRDVAMQDVESSNADAVGWLADTNTLYVRFLEDDGVYAYQDVDDDTWGRFFHAGSKGSFVHEHLKGQYNYVKIPDLPEPNEETDGEQ